MQHRQSPVVLNSSFVSNVTARYSEDCPA